MIQIKMEILKIQHRPINRWDKDSIRPGPVGSVGDVNLQVKLRNSAPYLPQRYLRAFSGKNEVYSGSNISDGYWRGFTSGGGPALTVIENMPYRESFKTPVGYLFENIVPVDRSRVAKEVPLGRYDWESQKARIYKAKTSGDQFLPLPTAFVKDGLPRGSRYPIIVAESTGLGVPLPAADVKITDPVFGEVGSIERPGTVGCTEEALANDANGKPPIWTPATQDPLRGSAPVEGTRYLKAYIGPDNQRHHENAYPDVGEQVMTYDTQATFYFYETRKANPCATQGRPAGIPDPQGSPPIRVPKEGDPRPKVPPGQAPPTKMPPGQAPPSVTKPPMSR